MHKVLRVLIAGALVGFLFWWFDRDLLHFLGWDGQTSDNYAAWSGSVPALFTLVGLSTIVTGLFHNVNCHEPGCWRIGKHKVDGSPWCNVHHGNARPDVTDSQRLDQIIALLEQIARPSVPGGSVDYDEIKKNRQGARVTPTIGKEP